MRDELHRSQVPFVSTRQAQEFLRRVTLMAACLLIALFAYSAEAQSGRRAPKAAAPVPKATPEEKPSVKSEAGEKPKINLTLGVNTQSAYPIAPLYIYDAVLESCADRLRDAPSLKLDFQVVI